MRIEGIHKKHTPFPRPCTLNDAEYRYLESIVLNRGRRVHTYERRVLIRTRRLRRLESTPVSLDRAAYVLFCHPAAVAEFIRSGRLKARRVTGHWKWVLDPSVIRRLVATLNSEDTAKDRAGLESWVEDFVGHVRSKYGEASAQTLNSSLREKIANSRAEAAR